MAQPLFTKEELDAYQTQLHLLEEKQEGGWLSWGRYSAEKHACEGAHQAERVKRAQQRAPEFLNALLAFVSGRGRTYWDFDDAFEHSDDPENVQAIAQCDTPEHRRVLHTILKALCEIPRTWAPSAFSRFLRGIGKQKGAKYYGAGSLGTSSGWTQREVEAVCQQLAGDRHWQHPYSAVLMSYADVESEVSAAEEAGLVEEGTHYEVRNRAARATRDVEFIQRLCSMLEERGLGEMPQAPVIERKPRKQKEFKPGDIVRSQSFVDLPLPARLRMDVTFYRPPKKARRESLASDPKHYVPGTIDIVVSPVRSDGKADVYPCARVDARLVDRAYPMDGLGFRKLVFDGATYLGPWTGTVVEDVVFRGEAWHLPSTHRSARRWRSAHPFSH